MPPSAHRRFFRRTTGAAGPTVLLAFLATCSAHADGPGVTPSAGGEARGDALATENARPSAAVAAVREALAEDHDAEAALAAVTGEPEAAAWLRAEIAAARGDAAAQATALEDVIALGGPLAPWARVELAELSPEHAESVLAPIATLDFPGRADVELRLAADEAALRAVVVAHPQHTRARRALADRLAESEDGAAREEALSHYRTLDARSPSRELEGRIEAVLASLPTERREALAEAPLADRLARAEALAAQQRHETSEHAFAEVARAAHDVPEAHETWCRAELGVGRARFRRRAREEAIERLEAMVTPCADVPDAAAWGRYLWAKSLANLDRRADAVAAWDGLAAAFPSHSLADDAQVEAARLLLRMGDAAGAEARLRAVTAMPVPGDMRGEARFLLAWTLRAAGDVRGALSELDASLAEGPGEHGEDVRGRAAFWRAQLLRDPSLGGEEAWADALEALARRDPLSFYGQLSRDRLAGVRTLDALPAAAAPTFRPDLGASAGLARAFALLRVGETSRAVAELEALGALDADASTETLWWVAALYDAAGAHHAAVELTRRRLGASLAGAASDPRFGAMIPIAYPRAYRDLIAGAADGEGIPPSLVFAIAREESSFEPRAVSVAHAYGMLQIIRPTARSIAERLGLPSDVHALSRPDVSVRIGARYLRDLSRRYAENPSVVPAAYNAGQGAVDRWLRSHGELALEEWIEEIPFAETRRYTRRVLMSQGVYEWLLTGALPSRSARLPRRG